MRARGLKLAMSQALLTAYMSRPMRARGLKQGTSPSVCYGIPVAPHAGAWIETSF